MMPASRRQETIISTRDAASTIAFEGLDSYQDGSARAAGLLLALAAGAVALAFFAGLLLADRIQWSAPSSPQSKSIPGPRLAVSPGDEEVYAVYFVASEDERALLLAAQRAANRSRYAIDPSTIYVVVDDHAEARAVLQVIEISAIRREAGLPPPVIQDLRLR